MASFYAVILELRKRSSMKNNSANDESVRSGLIPILIIIIYLSMECSCKHEGYNYSNYHELTTPDNIIKLHADVINKFDVNFLSHSSIIDGYLVFIDSKADKLVKIIDLNSYELKKSFGNLGQGPDEFIGINQIMPDPSNKRAFWIYDVSTKNLKYYNIINILNNNFYPDRTIRLSTGKSGLCTQVLICPDRTILGVGLLWSGRVSVYDMEGEFIRDIGKVPFIKKDKRFTAQHLHGFAGNIAYKPMSKEIYVATRLGTIVEKYSLDGDLLSTLIGPVSFFPEYDIVPAGQYYTMAYNNDTRFGYLDICYNEKLDRLFLLYSGKYQFHKDRNKRGFMGNTVFVLDERDEIVEQIELEKSIFRMTITEDGSSLFGLSEKEILKYGLIDIHGMGVSSRVITH